MEPVDVESNQHGRKYKWRIWARCIAFFDISTSSIPLLALVLDTLTGNNFKNSDLVGGLFWIFFSAGIALLALNIGLSYSLLTTATHSDADPGLALGNTKTWIFVHIIFFIFYLLFGFMSIITSVILIILRGIFLIIVWKFAGELQIAVDEEG